MTFFNSITNERKNQILSVRITSLKEQLWMTLIDAGLTPENLDMDNFDPDTEISDQNAHLRAQVILMIDQINNTEQIKSELPA
jgi:hypothetical protein